MEEQNKEKGSPGKSLKNDKSVRKSKGDDRSYRNVRYCVIYASMFHTDKSVFGVAL